MFKRITSIFLTLSLVFSLCCVVGTAAEEMNTIDFEDVSLSDWTQVGDGTMNAVEGRLQLASANPYAEIAAMYTKKQYSDFTAEFTYHFEEGQNNDGAMFLYRAGADATTGYAVYFVHCPDSDKQYYIKLTSRPYSELKNGMFFNDNGNGVEYNSDVQVKVVVNDNVHSLYVAMPGEEYGEPIYTYTEENALYTTGHVGFMQWHDGGNHQVTTAFDDLKITAATGDAGGTGAPDNEQKTKTFDFSDATALEGWNGTGKEIVDGKLQMGLNAAGENATVYTEKTYANFTAEFTYHFEEGQNNDGAMFLYRASDNTATGYAVYFVHCPDSDKQYYIKLTSRPYAELKNSMFFNDNGNGVEYNSDVQVKVVVNDNVHSLYVAMPGEEYGEPIYTYTEETALYTKGHVGFMQWNEGGNHQATVAFDDLKITAATGDIGTPDAPDGAQENKSFDFSDATALEGWNGAGKEIVDGKLQMGLNAAGENATVYTEKIYANFTAEFTYHFEEGQNNDGAMFLYRASDNTATGYAVYFVHCPDSDKQYYIKLTSRPYAELKNSMFFNDNGNGVEYNSDVQVKVVVNDNVHSLYVAMPGEEYGEPIYTYTEETALYTKGHVGFMQWNEGGNHQATVIFDDLKITINEDNPGDIGGDETPDDPESDEDETKYEVGTVLWESDLSSGDLTSSGLTTQYMPDGSKASWDIVNLNGEPTLRGQIAKFDDTIIRLTEGKYKDVTIEANIVLERGNAVAILGRLQDDGSGYSIILDQHDGIKLCQKNPYVAWKTGGMVELGTEYHVAMSISGNQIKAKVTNLQTGESILHEIENEAFTKAGYVGFSVFGFDNDGVSTATGLIKNVKVYYGAVDLDTLGTKKDETDEPGTDNPSDVPKDDEEVKEPDFSLKAKYTDVTVDNVAKKVVLSQKLTVSELKTSFTLPKGYSAKVVDEDGNEVTNDGASVTSEMKLVCSKEGVTDQVYTIEAPASSNIIWIIVAGCGVLAIVAAVALIVVIRKKKVQ